MKPTFAIAGATIAEAVRSRVVLGLVAGVTAAILGLHASATGDGSEVGRARAFLVGALDATWALLALAAVFLATTSLAREIEDGRAIPIAVTPVRPIEVLLGKWLGLGTVLGLVLAAAVVAAVALVRVQAREASEEGRGRIEREVLVSRNVLRPPKLDATDLSSPALEEPLARARGRLLDLKRRGDLPPGRKEERVLQELLRDEVVRALSVGPQRVIRWKLGPLDPAPDAVAITLRYRYRVLGNLPPGSGPRGAFALEVVGQNESIDKMISSTPDHIHEMPAPAHILREPVPIGSPLDGTIQSVEDLPQGGKRVAIDGTPLLIPAGFKCAARPGQAVRRGQVLATSDKIWLIVSYLNADRGVTVVFPPEGVELLYVDRPFFLNVALAYVQTLGRLLFLIAVGLAATTFLDGKVAALATFFVLMVATGHSFLDDAIGPITGPDADNVFGLLDAPIKAILHGVLLLLPDLGRDDPGEALAQGRNVLGALRSIGLAAGSGTLGLALGAVALGRRELGGASP